MSTYEMTADGRYLVDGVDTPKATALAAWRADPANAEQVNRQATLDKIAAAIAANARVESSMNTIINGVDAFLAIASPTTAQRNQFIRDLGTGLKMIAQDQKAQARQLTALARHAAQDFTSTDGT
jgi:hypothetical protein